MEIGIGIGTVIRSFYLNTFSFKIFIIYLIMNRIYMYVIL
jgi:hypothetical protein